MTDEENGTKTHQRPGWDEYFMGIANLVATRSTCLRRSVGAVLARERRLLSTGYNGAPSGLRHCLDMGCYRQQNNIPSGERHELCRGLHAEQNAIIQAALHGVSLKDARLYCTNHPCIICAKMIINAGITSVIIRDDYKDSMAEGILREAGVTVSLL